jgi:hypothetical protein
MGKPRPFDQVMIDGTGSSSPSDGSGSNRNPSTEGRLRGLTKGCSPATATGRGEAADSSELNEGRHGRSGSPEVDLHDGSGGARSRLQKVVVLVPWVKKRGRVRLVLQKGVHTCKKETRIGFRLAVFDSSSLQIRARVSSLLLCTEQGVAQGLSGELGGGAGVK